MARALCDSLLAKIDEQAERTIHLIGLLPADFGARESLIPTLLGHLLECLAGFCAVLYSANPEGLAHFAELRALPVNHACGAEEAVERIAVYRARIGEGFALLEDTDLARKRPTIFVPEGETLLTLLLGNLEHIVNHKHQLFTHLKLLGVEVSSRDLYRFRGRSLCD